MMLRPGPILSSLFRTAEPTSMATEHVLRCRMCLRVSPRKASSKATAVFHFRSSAKTGRERQCAPLADSASACPSSGTFRLSRACDVVRHVRRSPMHDLREKPTVGGRNKKETQGSETVMRGEMMLGSLQGYKDIKENSRLVAQLPSPSAKTLQITKHIVNKGCDTAEMHKRLTQSGSNIVSECRS